jgi:hypothetical protein
MIDDIDGMFAGQAPLSAAQGFAAFSRGNGRREYSFQINRSEGGKSMDLSHGGTISREDAHPMGVLEAEERLNLEEIDREGAGVHVTAAES